MPMESASIYGGGNVNNKYCKYCTTSDGKLKSRAEVRAGMIKYMMKAEKRNEAEAQRLVDEHMKRMPAWRKK